MTKETAQDVDIRVIKDAHVTNQEILLVNLTHRLEGDGYVMIHIVSHVNNI